MKRYTLYKVLPMAARELGMDTEAYRFFLSQHGAVMKGGRFSASTMSDLQLNRALQDLQSKGFVLKPKSGFTKKRDWRAPRLDWIKRMWAALYASKHGDSVINGSAQALNAFARRTCKGLDSLDWASTQQLNQLVEALKVWCKRCAIEPDDLKQGGPHVHEN
jgi:hypothetical protein